MTTTGLKNARSRAAETGRLALHQGDGVRWPRRLAGSEAAGRFVQIIDAPFAPKCWHVEICAPGQKLGDVEADAAGADDRDPLADRPRSGDRLGVAQDVGTICAGDVERARMNTGGDDDRVEPAMARSSAVGRVDKLSVTANTSMRRA